MLRLVMARLDGRSCHNVDVMRLSQPGDLVKEVLRVVHRLKAAA